MKELHLSRAEQRSAKMFDGDHYPQSWYTFKKAVLREINRTLAMFPLLLRHPYKGYRRL